MNSFIFLAQDSTLFSIQTLLLCFSKTLMKLAKGSNRKIESFLNHSHRQLQTTSLCSKLPIANDIVNECLYICNQNFDHRNDFHCVAMSDDDWMIWNFDNKTIDLNVISNHIPRFVNVYHVRVTRLHDHFFLKCDCLLYHRYVYVCLIMKFNDIVNYNDTNIVIIQLWISVLTCSSCNK